MISVIILASTVLHMAMWLDLFHTYQASTQPRVLAVVPNEGYSNIPTLY